METATFPLMRLPLELRREVYSHMTDQIVLDQPLRLSYYESGAIACGPGPTRAGRICLESNSKYNRARRERDGKTNAPRIQVLPLLLVNKEIYKEVIKGFYTRNVFHIIYEPRMWLDQIGPTNRGLLRRLVVQTGEFRKVVGELVRLDGLREMTFEFEVYSNYFQLPLRCMENLVEAYGYFEWVVRLTRPSGAIEIVDSSCRADKPSRRKAKVEFLLATNKHSEGFKVDLKDTRVASQHSWYCACKTRYKSDDITETPTKPTQSSTAILSLPTNIRERIYDYLIPKNMTIEIWQDHGKIVPYPYCYGVYGSDEPPARKPFEDYHRLLFVNHQIYNEVSSLLYCCNQIKINIMSLRLFELIGERVYKHWRDVEIYIGHQRNIPEPGTSLEATLDILRTKCDLVSFTMRLAVDVKGVGEDAESKKDIEFIFTRRGAPAHVAMDSEGMTGGVRPADDITLGRAKDLYSETLQLVKRFRDDHVAKKTLVTVLCNNMTRGKYNYVIRKEAFDVTSLLD